MNQSNLIEKPSVTVFALVLERSQGHVLASGYRLVNFKNKVKKRVFMYMRMLTFFNQ